MEAKKLPVKEMWRKPLLCAEAKIKKMKEKAEGGKEENNQREVFQREHLHMIDEECFPFGDAGH